MKWGFPKIRDTMWGVPRIGPFIFWGLHWGPAHLGKLPFETAIGYCLGYLRGTVRLQACHHKAPFESHKGCLQDSMIASPKLPPKESSSYYASMLIGPQVAVILTDSIASTGSLLSVNATKHPKPKVRIIL